MIATKKLSVLVPPLLALGLGLASGLMAAPVSPGNGDARGASEASNGRAIALPRSVPPGEGKEITVLLDEPHLKLATVALRGGTVLPPHSTPVPATILVLSGEGVIGIGGDSVAVTAGVVVPLAAGEEHDVVPRSGTDMLLLVHYLRGASGHQANANAATAVAGKRNAVDATTFGVAAEAG